MTVEELVKIQLAQAWALFLEEQARMELHGCLADAYALRIARLNAQLANPTEPVGAEYRAPDDDDIEERTLQ